MEQATASGYFPPDQIYMGSAIILTRAEIEAATDLRALVEAKAENLRKNFVETTIEEIHKRRWVTL